ncbi:hypothetical protein ACFO5R_07830 [Halosolutus amylolyticus]|uniref:DUF7847 domain-containing protein n=1 Tax=Halosolutus amylolyticus TaxID=2932267 RepID=A0ABD5PMM1_9EURY|nr:hypothetical protein [Halosolutus amylolyticus]
MSALQSLRPAISGVVRNPILLVITGLYGLVQLPQLALQEQDPLLATAVSLGVTGLMIFLLPFFQGGVIGMASEAIAGRTTLGTLLRSGKSNYVSLLLAYFVLLAVNFAFGMFVFFGILIGGVSVVAGGGEPGIAVLAVLGLFGLVALLGYLLVTFFVQFYAHAIVLSDTDLVGGFKTSVGLVRDNILSVVGYTAVLLCGSAILGGVGVGASFLFTADQSTGVPVPELSLPVLVAAGVAYLVAVAIGGAFYATYSVAFYQNIRSDDRRPSTTGY